MRNIRQSGWRKDGTLALPIVGDDIWTGGALGWSRHMSSLSAGTREDATALTFGSDLAGVREPAAVRRHLSDTVA